MSKKRKNVQAGLTVLLASGMLLAAERITRAMPITPALMRARLERRHECQQCGQCPNP